MGNLRIAASAMLLLALACAESHDPQDALVGEWTVEVIHVWDRAGGPGAAGESRGVVVFDRDLPSGDEDEPAPPPGTLFGRAYVDFSSPADRASSGVDHFAPGPDVDVKQEIIAHTQPDGEVYMEVAPKLIGFDPVLRGSLLNDTLRGDWVLLSHGDTLRGGHFVMWRVKRSAFSDSARVRARRASEQAVPYGPGETADTVPRVPVQGIE